MKGVRVVKLKLSNTINITLVFNISMSSPECDMFEAYYNGTMALLDGLQFTNTMFAQYLNNNTDKP